jgi:hypothetical protein
VVQGLISQPALQLSKLRLVLSIMNGSAVLATGKSLTFSGSTCGTLSFSPPSHHHFPEHTLGLLLHLQDLLSNNDGWLWWTFLV